MKIVLDHTRCQGFGLCQQAAPNVYRLDNDGELHLTPADGEVARQDEDAAVAGVHACPLAALRIADA